jgi:hypothetical protein
MQLYMNDIKQVYDNFIICRSDGNVKKELIEELKKKKKKS